MPNSDEEKRRKRPITTKSDVDRKNKTERRKYTKKKKISAHAVIEKSKQLAKKEKVKRTIATNSTKNDVVRVCGNGKPMPSLAELEKMFADSDDDNEPTSTTAPDRCKTPERIPIITEEKLMSPTTLKYIANTLMDVCSNFPDTTALLDNGPPPPIIPVKRPKKRDEPYIVGCKDRPQVEWNPKTSFCKGEETYGINKNSNGFNNEEPNTCPKRRKRNSEYNISKSIFNAQSKEIAAKLKMSEMEETLSDASLNSNETETYEYKSKSPSDKTPYSFSPLPSTSKDDAIISKNDELFHESLLHGTLSADSANNDLGIIDISSEIIVLDDTNDTSKEIDKPIVEKYINEDHVKDNSSHVLMDYYSSLNIDLDDKNDSCEIIDVDDVIAENKIIIEKYCKDKEPNIVTCIDIDDSINTEGNPKICNEDSAKINNNLTKNDVIDPSDEHKQSPPNSIGKASETSSICNETVRESILKNITANFFRKIHLKDHNYGINQNSSNLREPILATTSDFTEADMDKINYLKQLILSWTYPVNSPIRNKRLSKGIINQNDCAFGRSITSNLPRMDKGLTRINDPSNCFTSKNQNPIIVLDTTDDNIISSTCNIPKTRKSKKVLNQDTTTVIPTQQETSRQIGDCPICMDNLSNKAVASTICGHIFCMNCMKATIKAYGKKCPTCRKVLKGIGYHQLFL